MTGVQTCALPISLILSFRAKHGFGRAIAAPQIGLSKRIICLQLEKPLVMINPILQAEGDETMELWDDCMSFPCLLVKLKRHRKIRVSYTDIEGQVQEEIMEGDRAELIEQEYDHLDDVLDSEKDLDEPLKVPLRPPFLGWDAWPARHTLREQGVYGLRSRDCRRSQV